MQAATPLKPKKPQSSFFWYLKGRREAIGKEQPDLHFTKITKLVGAEWAEMTQEDK